MLTHPCATHRRVMTDADLSKLYNHKWLDGPFSLHWMGEESAQKGRNKMLQNLHMLISLLFK